MCTCKTEEQKRKCKKRCTKLEDLLEDMEPQEEMDWGSDVGVEIVDSYDSSSDN